MRGLVLMAAVAAGAGMASPAAAQQVWQNGRWVVMPQQPAPAPRVDPHRWGPVVDGRWEAATRAPGGWNAYRRPDRGTVLPRYWRDERFRIADYLAFGLAVPPQGYHWARYYDDAVLVDAGGRVWDSLGGIDWYGGSYAVAGGSSSSTSSSYSVAQAGAPYAPPPPRGTIQQVDPDLYRDRGDVRIAPGRDYDRAPPPPPLPPYPVERHGAAMAAAAAPLVQVYTTPACIQACPGYGYSAYGYSSSAAAYYAGGTTTTVVVLPPVTTTTVEETVTTTTSYVRAAARKRVVRRAAPRPRVRVKCCVCGCR